MCIVHVKRGTVTIVIAVSLLAFVLEAGVPMNETNASGDYSVRYEESMTQGKKTDSVYLNTLARDLKSLLMRRILGKSVYI